MLLACAFTERIKKSRACSKEQTEEIILLYLIKPAKIQLYAHFALIYKSWLILLYRCLLLLYV